MGNNRYKILVVEDEANIRSLLATVLESNNHQMLSAQTCEMGKTLFLSHHPDLVILDLGLPDSDGSEFIRFARKESDTPIIILSARSSEEDKVNALDIGANDYITKPFGTAELLARIRAALRSSRTGRASEDGTKQKFLLDDLEILYDKRELRQGGTLINLTQTEYNIIALLSDHAGKVLTYSTIIKSIWGYQDPGSRKRLQVNMANIRKKLGVTPGSDGYIINELGVGYRMREQNE